MTTIDTHPHASVEPRAQAGNEVGRSVSTVAAWLTAADHKRIGRLQVGASLVALVGFAVVAALVGFERIDTDATAFDGAFDQLYALSRVGLTFFVALPLMLGLAVAVVPLQLGARSLALPRLAAAGLWSWLTGAVLVVIAFAADGGPTGGDPDMVDLFLGGLAVAVVGLTATAGSLVTSILTTRAPGMHLRRMPPFAWSALVTGIGLLLMLPVLFGTLVLLFVDHTYGGPAFDDGIVDWMGWTLTQPQTYLFVLPALGLVAELGAVMGRARLALRGVLFTGIGLLGIAALAGVTQVSHDLPWPGSGLDTDDLGDKLADLLPYAFFNVLPLLAPVIVLGLVGLTVRTGRPRLLAPFVFAFFGLGMLLVGMAGQVLVPILDLGLKGTVFEEGSFVYVVYGGVLAAFGGVVYWGPKLWGRRIPDAAALPLALLGVAATILAALPYYIAGFADQPAASAAFDYSGSPELWNVLSTVGHALMALTAAAFVALALRSFTSGPPAGDDPWDAQTLEWATSSPPPADNFAEPPTVSSPEPLVDLKPSRSDAS